RRGRLREAIQAARRREGRRRGTGDGRPDGQTRSRRERTASDWRRSGAEPSLGPPMRLPIPTSRWLAQHPVAVDRLLMAGGFVLGVIAFVNGARASDLILMFAEGHPR